MDVGWFTQVYGRWFDALGDAKLEFEPELAATYRDVFASGDGSDKLSALSFINHRAGRDQTGFDLVLTALEDEDANVAFDACATCLFLAVKGHDLGPEAETRLMAFADGKDDIWTSIVGDTLRNLENGGIRAPPGSFTWHFEEWRHGIGEAFRISDDYLRANYRKEWADNQNTEHHDILLEVLEFVSVGREAAGYDLILEGVDSDDPNVSQVALQFVSDALADMRARHPNLDELIAEQESSADGEPT